MKLPRAALPLLLLAEVHVASAFAPPHRSLRRTSVPSRRAASSVAILGFGEKEVAEAPWESADELNYDESGEWINPANVPFTEIELAEQSAKLDALTEKWRKRQLTLEYEQSQSLGWSKAAEQWNGRSAMFFLLVGLITEYYTGQTVPQQVGTLLETLGVIGVRCLPAQATALPSSPRWANS